MDAPSAAAELLKRLREQGMTVAQALDEMRGKRFGLIAIIKALRAVEGISLKEGVDIIERRGDYELF